MKKLHLICNSHIDPIWQWDWNEGLGMAISTFWQAVRFHDEFDYIFCHGESVLYEYIEKHDKKLFAEIQALVKAGKWHIMGGWYIQPDCNAPGGEAFVRQAMLGQSYFKEKFGVTPKVALNFDSFGHSLGLPQILSKSGFEGYLFCRPQTHEDKTDFREFWWVGPDGSRIKAARADDETIYCSMFGDAAKDIKRKGNHYNDLAVGLALWGVGNHGGENSRKDLQDVAQMIAESKDVEIVHSTPEAYFAEINPTMEWHHTIQPLIRGSYSSMSNIKMLNRELEERLFATEKLCSVAEMLEGVDYNKQAFADCMKALGKLAFHDCLAGTIQADAEKTTTELAKGALAQLEELTQEAFLSLAMHGKHADLGVYPIYIFNFQPYKRKAVCETEIFLQDWLVSETEEFCFTATQNGKEITTQCIKELGNLNMERRKRVAFECELEPLNVTCVDMVLHKRKIPAKPQLGKYFEYSDKYKKLRINTETGLLDSFVVEGKELLAGGAFQPIMYDSTENPWGHLIVYMGENPVPFKLSECKKGVTAGLKQVRITEDGPLLTQVESVFELDGSVVILAYRIYKTQKFVDIYSTVFWNQKAKLLKYKVPANFDGRYIGQIAFATDYHEKDNKDRPTQRFVGFEKGGKVLAVYNNCIFDSSACGNDLYLLALNGAVHCGHRIEERPIVKEPDRYIPYIEQGKHVFEFRLSYDDVTELESAADEFLVKPYGYNFFPHGDGKLPQNIVEIDNRTVALKAMFKEGNSYVLHVLNNSHEPATATVTVKGQSVTAHFGKYEVKTFVFDGKTLAERRELIKY